MSGAQNAIEAGLLLRGRPRFPSTGLRRYDMTTETTDRAEVFSRPAAQFDGDGNIEVRASAALGCRRSLWYAATGYEPTNPPQRGVADGDGGGQRPGAGGGAGDGAGGLASEHPRPPGPADGDGANRPQHAGHRTPGRHGADAPAGRRSASAALPVRRRATGSRLRRRDGRRDQNAGTRGGSNGGGRWGPSAATPERWPRPPSTRSDTTATCGTW